MLLWVGKVGEETEGIYWYTYIASREREKSVKKVNGQEIDTIPVEKDQEERVRI